MRLVIDTGILGKICHPRADAGIAEWFAKQLESGDEIEFIIPEIADYELRREMLLQIPKGRMSRASLNKLDRLGALLDYAPLTTSMVRMAAQMWADARAAALPTASSKALDGDVLLAAQAKELDAVVLTDNRRHLERYTKTIGLDSFGIGKPGPNKDRPEGGVSSRGSA